MPILSPRPPSPRHRGVCVQRSQPPGKDTACAWLSQRGFGRRGWGDPWTAERVPRNGYGSHGNPGLLSQRSRSVLRERWLRCSDTVRGFRPGHVPLWVPDITARFPPKCVEGEFSEVRGSKRPIRRSGRHPTTACWAPFGVETWRLRTFRCTFVYQGVATRNGATTREIPAHKTWARPNFACVQNPRTYPP
jgi:hypothetical protein